jgi:hypothetical protein
MPKDHAYTLAKERRHDLKGHTVDLPRGKAAFSAVLAVRDGEIYD